MIAKKRSMRLKPGRVSGCIKHRFRREFTDLNTKTEDVRATVAQIQALTAAGCDIIRCAVPTQEAASALKEIKKQIHIPLVADIHFDYRLAIAAIENGADKIRINPGNIGSKRACAGQ